MIEHYIVASALDLLEHQYSRDEAGDFMVPLQISRAVVVASISIECDGRFLEIRSIGLPMLLDRQSSARSIYEIASDISGRYRAAKATFEASSGELVVCIDHWFRDSDATVEEVAFLIRLFVKVVREAIGAMIVRSSPEPRL